MLIYECALLRIKHELLGTIHLYGNEFFFCCRTTLISYVNAEKVDRKIQFVVYMKFKTDYS